MNDARYASKTARRIAELELIKELIRNPVFELLVLFTTTEALQKANIIPGLAGTALEVAGITAISLQQFAPLAQQSLASSGEVQKLVASKVSPLLLGV